MKKIMFFIPDLTSGGGERVVSELSLHFPTTVDVGIILLENKISYPYRGKIISLNIPTARALVFRIFQFFVILSRFRRIIKKEKPDYVISLHNVPNMINIVAGRHQIIRIDNPLSYGYKGMRKFLLSLFVKLWFNKATKIVAVSQGIKEDLTRNFGIKKDIIKVMYNPIDVEKIQKLSKQSLEQRYEAVFQRPVIINIGRLSEQKGQWHLIRIFREVKKQHRDVKLVIIGEGSMKSLLEKFIQELDLEDEVHLLGWQQNPYKFLARANMFVSSSLWEGLPMVMLEAIACGLPVISTDCKTGPREILAPDTDITYETKDLEYGRYGILTPALERKELEPLDPLTKSETLLFKAVNELLVDTQLSDTLRMRAEQRAKDFDIGKIMGEWNFLIK